jgi:ribosomal subunit interface protein
MNLVVKGRGDRVSAQTRQRLERKLGRVERLAPRVDLVEVEIIKEASKRVAGGHRVQATCRAARKTFRAHATGHDLDAALERAVERLARQVSDDHARRRARRNGSAASRRVRSEPSPLRTEG